MTGIHPKHLIECVIRPALKPLNLWSPSAEQLELLTIAKESGCGRYLMQNGKNQYPRGPALGICQMEPLTYLDTIKHSDKYIEFKRDGLFEAPDDPTALIYDLKLSVIMCRLKYTMIPEKLPRYDNLVEMARYWDTYYNANPDKGTPVEAIECYEKYILRYL